MLGFSFPPDTRRRTKADFKINIYAEWKRKWKPEDEQTRSKAHDDDVTNTLMYAIVWESSAFDYVKLTFVGLFESIPHENLSNYEKWTLQSYGYIRQRTSLMLLITTSDMLICCWQPFQSSIQRSDNVNVGMIERQRECFQFFMRQPFEFSFLRCCKVKKCDLKYAL